MNRRPTSTHEHYLSSAALPVKDVLRGVRHGLRSIRNTAASIQSKLPEPLGTLGATTISHMDWFVDKVDQNSSMVVHRYLDPQIAQDAETAAFSKLMMRHDAAVLFAKITYENLKLVMAYIGNDFDQNSNCFISEMLAAIAYQRAAGGFSSKSDEVEKAALILGSMLGIGVVRTLAGASAAHSVDKTISQPARIASFATMLWLVVERDYTSEDEKSLLFACCDLAMALNEEINAAGDDTERLTDLLKTHVDMV